MNLKVRWIGILVLLSVGLMLLGCGNKVSKENYGRIKLGMGYQAVVDILGAPDESKNLLGSKSCVWGKSPKTISVKFVADKVVFHSARGLQ